jgi:hypothetical protein
VLRQARSLQHEKPVQAEPEAPVSLLRRHLEQQQQQQQ